MSGSTRPSITLLLLLASASPALGGTPVTGVGQATTPTTLAAADGLRDIHGPLPLAGDFPMLGIGLAVLLALLLLLAVFLLWRRRGRQKAPATAILPWEEALQALDDAALLREEGDSLGYLQRTDHILRRYLELRFSLPSTRQTRGELEGALQALGEEWLQEWRGELLRLLRLADLAKFARQAGDIGQLQGVEDSLRRFIAQTTPAGDSGGQR